MNSFRSEYLKFIYNKWLLLTVLSTIILVPLFVIFLHETPSYITEDYVLTQILESFYLGQAGIIIITILFIGQEFNGSTLRSSLLANPTRWKFFFIKLMCGNLDDQGVLAGVYTGSSGGGDFGLSGARAPFRRPNQPVRHHIRRQFS